MEMVKYLSEMQELEIAINMAHIKRACNAVIGRRFNEISASGRQHKQGSFTWPSFKQRYGRSLPPSAPTILGLCASTPHSSIQTGYTKPTFNMITENFDILQ
jgi:hypothetical protein